MSTPTRSLWDLENLIPLADLMYDFLDRVNQLDTDQMQSFLDQLDEVDMQFLSPDDAVDTTFWRKMLDQAKQTRDALHALVDNGSAEG